MALNCGIHYKTIARISSDLKLSDWFWRDFWNTQKIGLNFDGELYGTGFTLPKLIEAGFTSSEEEGSNCCWNRPDLGYPDWLLQIRVIPDDDKVEPFWAFTTKFSHSDIVECAKTGLIYVRDINSRWLFSEDYLEEVKSY